ncbi:Crp/Fnr family transcriptional regulator [Novosphingobium guangzhouense]|nr:Crp/Fnr family transcriptional regulator [Novosphingobium guangzhouense]
MAVDHSSTRQRQFRRHEHLARKDEVHDHVFQIEDGWASRYCMLADGRRQITALYAPGDFCESQWLLSGRADYPIVALTPIKARCIPLAGIHGRPGNYVRQLLADMLRGHARQTSWIVSLGRQTAVERVYGLMSELYRRLHARGRVMNNRCAVPLTQQDIADAVGLTPVHVNRVLGDLRTRGLLELSGKLLHLPNPLAFGDAEIATDFPPNSTYNLLDCHQPENAAA